MSNHYVVHLKLINIVYQLHFNLKKIFKSQHTTLLKSDSLFFNLHIEVPSSFPKNNILNSSIGEHFGQHTIVNCASNSSGSP